MDLLGLRAAIREQTGLSSNDAQFPDSVLTGIVNAGLRKIANRRRWPWLKDTTTFATVSGTGDYALSGVTAWKKTLQLWITDDTPMIPHLTLEALNHRYGSGQGRPSEYAVLERRIYLRAIPQEAYTVNHEYLRTETALAADGATPLLPAEHHDIAVAYMCYLTMRRARQNDAAADFLGEYREGIRDLLRDSHEVEARPTVRNRSDWQYG